VGEIHQLFFNYLDCTFESGNSLINHNNLNSQLNEIQIKNTFIIIDIGFNIKIYLQIKLLYELLRQLILIRICVD